MPNSSRKPTPKSSFEPPSFREHISPFTQPPFQAPSAVPKPQIIGPTKERMEHLDSTIVIHPPPSGLYHAAKPVRVPNPKIAGQHLAWPDTYRRAATWNATHGLDQDTSPATPHTTAQATNTHPPPHPTLKPFPSSPPPPTRVINPVPHSLRPEAHLSGLRMPRSPYTHVPIVDTSSYVASPTASTHTAQPGHPVPPPTDTDVGRQFGGYQFVGAIAPGVKGKGRVRVKFESEVEVRTFGEGEEPKRAVRGHEEIWRWMEGDVRGMEKWKVH